MARQRFVEEMNWRIFLTAIVMTCRIAHAQGGPPLITDDPGTPGDGHWELNLAAGVWDGSNSRGVLSAPYADINYGWGEHLQLKFETGGAFLHESGHILASGLSEGIFGVKYRFLDEENAGVAVSTYPQIQFPMARSQNAGLADPATNLILPLEFEKTFGSLAINPDLGYIHSTQSHSDQLFYGLALGFELAKTKELLAEVHCSEELFTHQIDALWNIGARWGLTENLSFMGSLGHTFKTQTGEQPSSLFWIGIQIRT